MQSTIRQLDIKANAMLVVLTLLLANASHIILALHMILCRTGRVTWLFAGLLAACWILAVIASCRVISAIANPAQAVGHYGTAAGIFYVPNKFDISKIPWHSALMGDARPREVPTLALHVGSLPTDAEHAIRELAFEQLKLAYIRDVKSLRLKYAIAIGLIALLLAAAIWIAGLVLGNGTSTLTLQF